jgi:hypothetical protein
MKSWNPLSFYLDTVDTSAFDKAQSGQPIGQYDAPFLPLIMPWVIGGPVLAFAHLSEVINFVIIVVCMAASMCCWAAGTIFYYRRVKRHRVELGIELPRLW